MNAYDYDAVIYDGEIYCAECLPDGVEPDSIDEYGNDLCYPIFANSEWDYVPVCDVCRCEHDYVTVIDKGDE